MKFTSVKVSNNALNFLLAQYRAIFKRAYVKGLASAVLLTAGLAAGQAQAYTDLTQNTAGYWEQVSNAQDLTVSGETAFTSSSLDTTKVYNDIIITNGGTLKNSGTASQIETIIVKGDITINNGGKLTLTSKESHIAGFDLGTTGSPDDDKPETAVGTLYNKKDGTLTIGSGNSNSYIQMHSAVLETGSKTIINGSGASTAANSTVGTAAYLFAGFGENPGKLEIQKDATVEIKDFGYLGIESKGQMTIDGNVEITASDANSFAGIRAADSSSSWSADTNSTVNLTENADITVKAGSGKAMLLAPQVNINGATINVEDGATFYLSGDVETNKESGSAMVAASAGQFNMTSGKLNVAGTLVISNGKYEDDSDATADLDETKLVNTLTITDGELNGTGTVQVAGKFAATAGIVDAFLSGKDANGTTNSNDGHFVFSGGSSVFEVTGSDQFDLAKYTWSGSGTADDFIVSGNGTVQGENLAISSDLKNASDADAGVDDKLSVKATNLTLGGGTGFVSADHALGVKDMTAQNVTFLADSGSNADFTLQEKLTLIATQELTNPYDSTLGTLTYAAKDTIDGNVIVSGGSGKGIVIQAGHYTTNDDITVSGSGSRLVVNNINNASGVDASLTLGSSSTLSLIDGAWFSVIGNQSKTINFGDHVRSAEVYADISAAELVLSGDGSNINRFDANNGTLIMDEDQLAKIVNSNNTSVVLQNYGTAIVQGDIAGENNSGLDVSKFAKTVKAGSVVFANNNGGILEATGQIWLKADSASNKLDISDKGTIQAETLRLDNVQDIPSTDTTTVRQFVVADGTLIAGSTVTTSRTDHNSTLTLGDGASGATLQLGYIEDNVDEWGMPDHTYTTSSDTGIVSQNLSLVGTGADASSLNVVYGTWTAQDISVTGDSGAITVGYDGTTKYDANGNEVVFSAALKADELSLSGANSKVTINDNGTMSVNGLTMSNGTVTVHGQMTVAGVEAASDATDPNYGVSINGGTFKVAGRNAQLTFGEQAVKNITVNGNEVTTENFISNITVEDYATLRLEFANGTSFTEAALSDLRKDLLANAADGLALDDGYIHLGNGGIAGLNVSGGTIDWDVLSKFKDIKDIRTEGMDAATLINVDEQDIITANVGNIQANGNTQNVQLSDSVLSSAKDLGNGTSAFITNANGEVIGATVKAGAVVGFNGGGAVRDLVMETSDTVDNTSTVVNIASSGEAVTSFESINPTLTVRCKLNAINIGRNT